MFSALHHFCVQTASNHFAVLQSVGDLSSLIDSCGVNDVAAVDGTQKIQHVIGWWCIAHSVTANFSVMTSNDFIWLMWTLASIFLIILCQLKTKLSAACLSSKVIDCLFYTLICLLWIYMHWAISCAESSALWVLLVNYHKLSLLFVYYAHFGN